MKSDSLWHSSMNEKAFASRRREIERKQLKSCKMKDNITKFPVSGFKRTIN